MAMTPYTGEVETIAKIGTTPQERAMETAAFKAAFSKDLKAFVTWFNATHKTEFDTHLAETASLMLYVTRDISAAGVQTVSLGVNRKPKKIEVYATAGTPSEKVSFGAWCENGTQRCLFNWKTGTAHQFTMGNTARFLRISEAGITDYTDGLVQNVANGSFEINWTKGGNGATGTLLMNIVVTFHD